MKRFGLDLDGVVYMWSKTARYMLREVLPDSWYKARWYDPETHQWHVGAALKQESSNWDYIAEHIHPDDWDWLWDEGVRLGLFRYGHLYPGSIKALMELRKRVEIVVITHRPKSAVADTLDFLSYIGGRGLLEFSGVHLLTQGERKSSVRPECDYYLDDKPENCEDLAEKTRGLVMLWDRPWNQEWVPEIGTRGEEIVTVSSWKDVLSRVE